MKKQISTILFIALTLNCQALMAKNKNDILGNKSLSPEQIGYEIAKESDVRDVGFVDSKSDMEMVLKNEHGQEITRKIQSKTLENYKEGLGDKSISFFLTPEDIKGTAVLTHSKVLEADDQWLYLPALKRVKRISSSNKSGPFLGSEFAYEDIGSQEVGKYSYKFLKTEKCPQNLDKSECFVVESYPKYEHSGYSKRIAFIDTLEFRLVKIEFFDRKNELLKTLTYHDYEKYLQKFWRAKTLEMYNNQSKKSTKLIFNNYKFKNGLKDSDFDEGALKRI